MLAVVTGASAGVGRATAGEFAARGCDVGLIARNAARLEATAAELRSFGVRAVPVAADVADGDALEAAAERIEAELGPIDLWVNNAMATIFAPVDRLSPAEFRRATEVTYLGQVYGTMTALRRMRQRDSGTIVNVGSALCYRAIPLQSVYCGAKYAVRGFTDSLRSELLHDGSKVRLVMVHLPAVNTPQFDWALNKTGSRPQPVPPIFQPEVPARAIVDAALDPRGREVWVGLPTWKAIIANKLAPGLLDRYLAKNGYSGQLTEEPTPLDAPANLFRSVDGDYGAHGRFDDRARSVSVEAEIARHRGMVAAAIAALGLGAAAVSVGATRLSRRRAARPGRKAPARY
ncbi:MAG TPA: SDR family oxidoreductase [Stellaceae bacterium]|nr:SDR family oxidoreductase [Stellaceae bacterium]